jgi:type III secretion system FlhB-like substrate exporter
VDNRKGDVADAIGMPDEKDLETMMRIINRFKKTHPGILEHTVKNAREEFSQGKYNKNLVWKDKTLVNEGSNMTYDFELPVELYQAIEQVFPSMFKSKKHYHWFKKNFYGLTIKGTQ